ncbi:MAG: hypothetical protein HDR88_09195 [Bacteroides sp.]|nr:hypothetical protein [Bacteroides sp.]
MLAFPLAFFTSCSDDDDLPQVDLTLTVSGVTQYDNAFYAIQGNTETTPISDSESDSEEEEVNPNVVTIDGLKATSLTNQNAGVTNVVYFLDGIIIPPQLGTLNVTIPTASLSIGTHTLSLSATVLQVDKTIANVTLRYPLCIVASAEDLPIGAPEIGTYSVTTTTNTGK